MAEKADELNKLISIATDLGLSDDMRIRAIERLGNIGTKEALRALLDLAANEAMVKQDREIAIKQARNIIRSEP